MLEGLFAMTILTRGAQANVSIEAGQGPATESPILGQDTAQPRGGRDVLITCSIA